MRSPKAFGNTGNPALGRRQLPEPDETTADTSAGSEDVVGCPGDIRDSGRTASHATSDTSAKTIVPTANTAT